MDCAYSPRYVRRYFICESKPPLVYINTPYNFLFLTRVNQLHTIVTTESEQPEISRKDSADNNHEADNADNAKEPTKALAILARNWDVHSPETADQVQRNEQTGEKRHLAQDLVDMIAE